ncbi:MAG: MFS transporter [Clostridiales bacterium]|jgi:MFS family permease|nr:MFS transporter [Clostridiales bacterium]
MKPRHRIAAVIEAFGMYLLVGAGSIIIGSSLPQLSARYGISLPLAAALSSSFAAGRISTVFISGMLAERLGIRKVLILGVLALLLFFLGLPSTPLFAAGLTFAFIGGAGMGAQDVCCPLMLRDAFPRAYASAMSASQIFFGAGSFLPPLIGGILLSRRQPFYCAYYVMAILAAAMLITLPFALTGKTGEAKGRAESRAISTRQAKLLLVLTAFTCFFYSFGNSALHLYLPSYIESRGFAQHMSVMSLAFYSAGIIAGALLFTAVFRRASPMLVLMSNISASLICLSVILVSNSFAALMAMLAFAGMFLGVLYTVLVAIAISLTPNRAGRAAAAMAAANGAANIASPLIAGAATASLGAKWVIYCAIIMLAAALASAFSCRLLHKRAAVCGRPVYKEETL